MPPSPTPTPRWSRPEIALLALLMALATWLRLRGLGEWSQWLDETLSWNDALSVLHGTGEDLSAPFTLTHRLQVLSLRLFGATDLTLRLPATVIGLGTLPVLHILGRRHLGPATSLTALALLATSPWHLFWSQSARAYTLVLLLWTVGTLCLLRPKSRARWPLLAGGALLVLGGIDRRYVFLHAAVLLPIMSVVWWRTDRGLRRWICGLALAGIGAVIGYEILSASMDQMGLRDEFSSFAGRGSRRTIPALFKDILRRIGWPVMALTLMGTVEILRRGRRGPTGLLLMAGIPFATMLALTPFAKVFERYAFHGYAALLAVASIGLLALIHTARSSASGWLRLGTGLAASILLAGALTHHATGLHTYLTGHGGREDWKTAFEHVADSGGPQRPVLWFRWPVIADRYLQGSVLVIDLDTTEPPSPLPEDGTPRWILLGDNRGDRPYHRKALERGAITPVPGEHRTTLYRLEAGR